jgi:hypothetical protein
MQLSFHSLLASAQEVDFFTDVLLDTGLSGDLEPDTSFVTELESIPPTIIEAEEESAIEEQIDIEMALDEENLKFEYSVVVLNHTNDTAEEEWGTWEDCTKFVVRYQRLMFGHRFDARFFHVGDDNEYASVQFNPTPSDPTGYLTLTMPRRY